jgi:hypothetical protein
MEKLFQEKYFYCPRPKIEESIIDCLKSKKIAYIMDSPKKGKTEVALKASNQGKNYSVYISLRYCQDYNEFQSRIIKGIIESELETKDFKTVLSRYSQYSPIISLNTHMNKFEVTVPRMKYLMPYEMVFGLISSPANKTPVFIIDNIEDLLRNVNDSEDQLMDIALQSKQSLIIIENSNVFTGENFSKKLDKLNQIAMIDISTSEYYNFVLKMFETKKVLLSYEMFKMIVDKSGIYLADNQLMFNMILEMSEKNKMVDHFLVNDAFGKIIYKFDEVFDFIYFDLSPIQKTFVRCLAEDKHIKLYGKELSDKIGLDKPYHPNIVSKTLESLVDKNILIKEGRKNYVFYNPFYKDWILKNFRYN